MVVCAGEFGADLDGVGMLQVLEDDERVLHERAGLNPAAVGFAGEKWDLALIS